jgi:hypothetical protein
MFSRAARTFFTLPIGQLSKIKLVRQQELHIEWERDGQKQKIRLLLPPGEPEGTMQLCFDLIVLKIDAHESYMYPRTTADTCIPHVSRMDPRMYPSCISHVSHVRPSSQVCLP